MRTLSFTVFIVFALAFLYWRFVWFVRNPRRSAPAGENLVSPADGRVVYVEKVKRDGEVFTIKGGVRAKLTDIAREDMVRDKVLIGIFMSPFNVHYNRAPLAGTIESIRHYPPEGKNLNMAAMHLRTIFKIPPYYRNSLHIVQNERTVTKIQGRFKDVPIPCYVIQIAGKTVRAIVSFYREGMLVDKGDVFGMVRIGSQVDIVVPLVDGMRLKVRAGDKVRAGQTILME